jgi:hypothetical protein
VPPPPGRLRPRAARGEGRMQGGCHPRCGCRAALHRVTLKASARSSGAWERKKMARSGTACWTSQLPPGGGSMPWWKNRLHVGQGWAQ